MTTWQLSADDLQAVREWVAEVQRVDPWRVRPLSGRLTLMLALAYLQHVEGDDFAPDLDLSTVLDVLEQVWRGDSLEDDGA